MIGFEVHMYKQSFIMICRYPDGARDPWNQPATSKLKVIPAISSYNGRCFVYNLVINSDVDIIH